MNETEATRAIAEAIYRAQAGGDVEREAERALAEIGAHAEYVLVNAAGGVQPSNAWPTRTLDAALVNLERERLYIDAHRNNDPAWRQAQLAGLRIQVRLVTAWTDREDTTP